MRKRRALLASIAAIAFVTSAHAAPPAPLEGVDARVQALYAHHGRTGRTLPLFRASPRFESSGEAPLLVRLRAALTEEQTSALAEHGVAVGRPIASGALRMTASEAGLLALLSTGKVARVSVDLPPPALTSPLDEARQQSSVDAAAAAFLAQSGARLTGRGVTVGDLDTSADIFHPAFFHVDGAVPWVDVDGDGALTPGVDGLDLDGDGSVDDREVLWLYDGAATSLFGAPIELGGGSAFDPGWDYLFLDLDGDGRRGSGIEVEGAESLGALGEPVLAGDDVDGDGTLRVPERLLRLGASKVRAIHHAGKTHRRGESLATFRPVNPADLASHGTRMLGAVAGGQPGASRFLGVAPEVDLLLATYGSDDASLTDKLQFLLDEGADVVLAELSYFGTDPSDGSTELELLIDAAVEAGKVVVVPAGNLGASTKHDAATIPPPSAPTPYLNEIVFEDPATTIWLSVTWREGAVGVTGSLELGDGDLADLSTTTPAGATPGGRQLSVVHGTTPRGAGYLLVTLSGGAPLPLSGNVLSLRTDAAASATARLFVRDDVSGYSGGANFTDGDVAGCLTSPAFAERALAVGAYGLHVGGTFTSYPPDVAGALREYSGRGPDLWDNPAIALAAPDNPIAPAPDTYGASGGEGIAAAYQESGGTSGAGALAAGVVALFRQAHPDLAGSALRDAVVAHARIDEQVTAGEATAWGAGKLAAPGAPAPGAPRPVEIEAPTAVRPGQTFEVRARFTDGAPSAGARARWDWNYDGTWDTEWSDALGASASSTMGAWPAGVTALDLKVEVMDGSGWTTAAVVRVAVADGGDDDGCGCRAAGRAPRSTGHWALALGAVAAWVLRARNRQRGPLGARRECARPRAC